MHTQRRSYAVTIFEGGFECTTTTIETTDGAIDAARKAVQSHHEQQIATRNTDEWQYEARVDDRYVFEVQRRRMPAHTFTVLSSDPNTPKLQYILTVRRKL